MGAVLNNPVFQPILDGLSKVAQNLAAQDASLKQLKQKIDELIAKFQAGSPITTNDLQVLSDAVNKVLTASTTTQADVAAIASPVSTVVPDPTGITVAPPALSLVVGQPATALVVTDTNSANVTADSAFSVDDTTVAAVDGSGNVTGIAPGTTNVQVVDDFGNKATVPVVVAAATPTA